MPASISLSGLSYTKADGTPLFTDVHAHFSRERTGIVGRNGVGKTTLLRLICGDLRPTAGNIKISGKIAILRQDAIPHPDETIADLFGVRSALDLLERADNGLISSDELADADWTLPTRLSEALIRCGLSAEADTPLHHLSGGQRSRAAIAACLFSEPDFLLLDEPTINLDQSGRDMVRSLIKSWPKGAIIVSHDRDLLEDMDSIVELTMFGATRYGGNYSAFRQRKDAEILAAEQEVNLAEKARDDVNRRAQQASERKARKDSAGKKARAKRDQPKIMLDFAKERAESSAGDTARLYHAQRHEAEDRLSSARSKVEILQPLRMDIPPTHLPAGKTVLRLDHVTGGYNPAQPVIHDLSLTITGPEHVLIAGPNGSGKTTLIKIITGQICPQRGTADIFVPYALLDQHMGLFMPDKNLCENYLLLNPTATIHMAHSALARFGFRADAALLTPNRLSGGQRLRAGLACVLGADPQPMLLILDEPTNHLDMDGIAALEAALKNYDGAVLVVSHDDAFVKTLAPHHRLTLSAQ